MSEQLIALALQYGLQYGIPALAQIVQMIGKIGGPSADDWAALIKLCSTTAKDQMLATLQAHGIDPNSDQGKAFLALVPA